MDNSRDSVVDTQDLLAAIKFWHGMAGLYFWEFVTTLDFEWGIIRGHRPYRWTIVMYSVTRVATLMAVILCLITSDDAAKINCQVEVIFQFFFGYLAVAGASLLIVLRMYVVFSILGNAAIFPSKILLMDSASIAIWNRKKFIIAISAGLWATNVGSFIHSVVQMRATWAPEESTCMAVNIHSTKLNLIIALVTDIILLLIMLIGLLRLGFHETGVRGIGHLMWTQGLVWLFFATIAYVPPVVLVSLNLSDSLYHTFQVSAVITISIAATRVYRSLVDFSSTTTDIAIITDRLRPIAFTTSKVNQGPAQPILIETLGATVHETYEQHQTPRNSQYPSSINREDSLRDTATGLGLDYDIERGAESGT